MPHKTSVQSACSAAEKDRPVLSTVSGAHSSKSAAVTHYQREARIATLERIVGALAAPGSYIEVGDCCVQFEQQPETDPDADSEPAGYVVRWIDGRGRDDRRELAVKRFDEFTDAMLAALVPASCVTAADAA